MARKTKVVEITEEGRDKGKKYLLTEMSATKAEAWAMRAFLAASRSGIEIPDEIAALGLAGLAMIGLAGLKGVNYYEIEPLLLEMIECVQVMPNPNDPNVVRKLIEDDIEEVPTRLKLREEVFKLHTDFLAKENHSTSQDQPLTKVSSNTSTLVS